ncbi:MAG: hypothetical protein Q8L48_21650 [Archangium sp.]|nr:hypothetical protein [Archangium sp.]
MGILIIVGFVVALIASFFVSGEEHQPGRFFIERQAYWNGGTYYVKYTWLTVLFTLADVVIIPLIIISGVGALMRNRDNDSTPPLDWDTAQRGRRLKQVVFVLVATTLWVAYTGAAVLAPSVLKPAGFFASILLLFVPIVPVAIAAFTFEALVAPQYVEGQLESLQIVTDKNTSTAHLRVSGADYQTQPGLITGLAQGARVGLVVSGFFHTILRVERRG